MPKYILLASWTDQGMRNIRDSAKRLDAGLATGKQQGCIYEKFFMTLGGNVDMVSVVDAPDDETLAKHVLTIGAGGNIRIVTLKAFPEETYRSIIASLPATSASG
jgi:uncharacterized protein with GYD domain